MGNSSPTERTRAKTKTETCCGLIITKNTPLEMVDKGRYLLFPYRGEVATNEFVRPE
jgi:hypothetical protein